MHLQGEFIGSKPIANPKSRNNKKMKIAILSLNPGHNYGGIIQSYALKTVLERMGHEVMVISRDRFKTVWSPMMLLRYGVRLFRRLVFRQPVGVFYEKGYNDRTRRTYGKMLNFCIKKLNLRLVKNLNEIKEGEFDAIIVGSDQVWRPKYFKKQYQTTAADAFLKFAEHWNIKRIAYAPSFGVDEWEYTQEETQECAQLIHKFDGISVREQSAIKLCKDHLNVDAVCLCDPTMLLSKEDYESLIDESIPRSKGNLLVYCLDKSEELDNLVAKISSEKHLTPFSTNADESEPGCQKDSVESWIRGFMDAEFVITDSFHACVFSLIFHKPFVVLGNRERGMSRFESLLHTFHQEQRLLYNASNFHDSLMSTSFDSAEKTFVNLRQQSTDYLKRTLHHH